MPALANNPVMPFGKLTIAAGGTPQLLFTTGEVPVAAQGVWPVRVARILITALPANAGVVYLGVKNMVVSTGVKVIGAIPKPLSATDAPTFEFPIITFGANYYRLQDYWIDGTTNDTVLRTVWLA